MEEIVHVNTGSNRAFDEENFEVGDDIRTLMMNSSVEGSSFTALLELSSSEAFQLLHCSNFEDVSPGQPGGVSEIQNGDIKSVFRSSNSAQNADLSSAREDSPDSSSVPSNSSANSGEVRSEPPDSDSNRRSSSPFSSDPVLATKKRKEREKKCKSSVKNVRTAHESSDETEKLPYVHVRARRGQATDSHSLAERARREKINARMKLLQELVPGCSKISGTALVLDEIINHVQYLQRQVEVLSMKLATVSPKTDFNLERLLGSTEAMQSETRVGGNVCNMFLPFVLGEGQYRLPWRVDDTNALHFPTWGRNEEISLLNREHSEIAGESRS